jgi:NifU-like protein
MEVKLPATLCPFPWCLYSRKLAMKVETPRSAGIFKEEEALERGVRLAVGEAGSYQDGAIVVFYWLVDKEEGMILDAKYQAYGPSSLIGAAEAACDLLIGKNYDQARRITSDLIDRQLRDKENEPAFPEAAYPYLNLVIDAMEKGSEKCSDLPLPTLYVAPPVPLDIGEVREGGYPGWKELSLRQKIGVIDEVLDQDIRPYIALDEGGVQVINLLQDKEVIISYQGSCTSCYSSVGSTLSYIQHVLRAKVHPDLVVTPDIDPSAFH